MRFDVDIEGDERFETAMRSLGDQALIRMTGAVYMEANDVFNQSQAIVPVDTGTLKSSGTVFPPEYEGPYEVSVRVGYGGAASEYAIYVHEILDNYHAPPTQAKFLEAPLMAALPGLPDRLARRLMSP